MDYKKIVDKLEEYERELLGLKKEDYRIGRDQYYKIHEKVIMIIRRVYPEKMAKEIENRFFSYFGVSCGETTPEKEQREYLDEIGKDINAIGTIKEEFDLFGFDDFKSIKEKEETEVKVGVRDIFWRKKKNK